MSHGLVTEWRTFRLVKFRLQVLEKEEWQSSATCCVNFRGNYRKPLINSLPSATAARTVARGWLLSGGTAACRTLATRPAVPRSHTASRATLKLGLPRGIGRGGGRVPAHMNCSCWQGVMARL